MSDDSWGEVNNGVGEDAWETTSNECMKHDSGDTFGCDYREDHSDTKPTGCGITSKKISGGFSDSISSHSGSSRGRRRGGFADNSGFGSGSNNNDSVFGENSGFGSYGSGGGPGNTFGAGADSGFGSKGFGSFGNYSRYGRGGDMKCYNCNGEGHQSRDCCGPSRPHNGGSRGDTFFEDTAEATQAMFAEKVADSKAATLVSLPVDLEAVAAHLDLAAALMLASAVAEGGVATVIANTTPFLGCRTTFREVYRADLVTEAVFVGMARFLRPAVSLKEGVEDEDVAMLYREHIEQGEMFTKLFEAEVTLTQGGLHGRTEKGKKISSFEELELPEQIAENIVNCGYKNPTPIQQYAIPAIFKGRDIMACAQTGSGKTAAFLLPVMTTLIRTQNLSDAGERTCCPRCIIIAPTRELAVQIYNEGRKLANGTVLRVACIYGGTAVMIQRQQLNRGATILVATVGRLKHFLSDGFISLREIKYLILDEADRMLNLGFEDSINFIFSHPSLTPREERQTFMFSATFPPEVQSVATQQLRADFLMITCGKIGVANKCIQQEIIEVTSAEQKKEKLLQMLEIDLKSYVANKDADVFNKKTMVFVSRKFFADTLGVLLCQAGIPSTTIHGDRGQDLRTEAINDFKYGRKAVLIATAVGERGLDIKGVDHVINYDLPSTGEDYIHRIGRTGRAGNPGRATSFYYAAEDRQLAESLVGILTEAGQEVPEFLNMEIGGFPTGKFSGFGDDNESAGVDNTGTGDDEEWD
ncbi:DEAD/DEAH box helicase [Necator americanus]|uniref:RNA helicase n=1 Tax=Necator americanus TaxID=51031 RepID=W2TS14_NECAM|nr:DEAD/DEAH box helicase [Necator americanus]ETN83787.1 DEAD/DEAH box helicase [Necator americanus]